MTAPDIARPATGRNDPCPCGSGRKYKHCCAMSRPAASQPRSANAGQQAKAADELRMRGMQLIESGRSVEAAITLRKAVQLNPGSGLSHHALGVALLRAGQPDAAEISLRQAVALDRTLANAHLDLGIVLDTQGRDAEALQAYGRAVALSPRLSDAHRRIGELWQARGQMERAIESYHRAASAARDTSAGRLLRAKAVVLEGKVREAEQILRKLVALDRTNTKAENALADVLITQGQFAEGIRHYERSLVIDPRQVSPLLGIARVMEFTDADRPRLAAMQAAVGQAGLTDKERMLLHFALGKASHDLGDYAGAMRHFDAANDIRSRAVRFDRDAFAARVDGIIRRFTSKFFTERAALVTADETPLLIVGMPRSGTTLVEQIVSSHPAVAAGEELVFWTSLDPALETAHAAEFTPESARALAAAYLDVLHRISRTASRVTDKMPFNFLQLGLIHVALPNARIIHCRRDPIDICLSIYSVDFDSRIAFAASRSDLAFYYRQYARLMDHWRAVLPADRFIEVQYERLIEDRATETRRLIAFAGLDWDDACLLPEKNERAVRTASVWQVRRPVYASSVERWRRYEPWLGELAGLADHPHAAGSQRHC
jgi:tetratricopeptide (TPR) repeat protein